MNMGRSSPPSPRIAARLGHVSEKFSAFYHDLEQEKQNRKMAEQQRFASLQDRVSGLEQRLEQESQRRAEAHRLLQSHVDNELRAVRERMTQHFNELQGQFKSTLDSLTRSVSDVHIVLREEKDQRRQDVEHVAENLVARVEDCVAAIDDERVARLEREAQMLKRVGEDIFRLQEKIDGERQAREVALTAITQQAQELSGNRGLSDEKFQALMMEEVNAIKSRICNERDERVAEDEAIVSAVNDYTKALQDGLRIVNTS